MSPNNIFCLEVTEKVIAHAEEHGVMIFAPLFIEKGRKVIDTTAIGKDITNLLLKIKSKHNLGDLDRLKNINFIPIPDDTPDEDVLMTMKFFECLRPLNQNSDTENEDT